MLNYERIVEVLVDELGEVGAEAVSDAIGLYLKNASANIGCGEEVGLLWPLFYSCDLRGLNTLLRDFDPLRSGMNGVRIDFE